jgi:hypothetical protein
VREEAWDSDRPERLFSEDKRFSGLRRVEREEVFEAEDPDTSEDWGRVERFGVDEESERTTGAPAVVADREEGAGA